MQIPNRILNELGVSIGLTDVMWIAFGVAFLVWFVVSIVLVYHWVQYGHHRGPVALAGVIYGLGSVFLLLVAASSLLYL